MSKRFARIFLISLGLTISMCVEVFAMLPFNESASILTASSATPVPTMLPQKIGTERGPPVPSSFGHGAFNGPTPILYPANLGAATAGKLISPPHVLSEKQTDAQMLAADGVKLQSVNLRRWGDVEKSLRGLSLASISADRLVYELVATFTSPYTYRGNTWSSGGRIMVIDAQTRTPLCGRTGGRMTHSNHQDDMRELQHQPPLHP